MLNSDELGEKGQARFKEICADAKLVCNQADRDRTGWDFIVEFPFETRVEALAPLESRKVPLSCHVQVKTLLEKNDSFKMRLSSAERLAKELKPSFVYVFKVNAEQFTGARLIHIFDERLAKILKRLRKEDVAANLAPNKKTISMSARRDGITVEPTGRALREALVRACGADLHAYTKIKAEQLAELGFEERPYELQTTLYPVNMDDLVDVFLGLKKEFPVANLSGAQWRFGIKLPVPGLSGDGAITNEPSPIDECVIIFRSDIVSRAAVFKGRVFFPAIPNLPLERGKFLFETDFFSMTVSRASLSITTLSVYPGTP